MKENNTITNSLQLIPVVVCSVFSNLLRNAIVAAREAETYMDAYVSVKAGVKGDFLHIKVENSYNEKQKKKTNRKGYGLSILKTIEMSIPDRWNSLQMMENTVCILWLKI